MSQSNGSKLGWRGCLWAGFAVGDYIAVTTRFLRTGKKDLLYDEGVKGALIVMY